MAGGPFFCRHPIRKNMEKVVMEERRTFLKRTGLILLGLAGSAAMSPDIARSSKQKRFKPAMIIDVNRCMGCQSCVIACKEQNHTPEGFFNTWIKTVEQGSYPKTWNTYTPDQCHQCDGAPCVEACLTGASIQLPSGVVVIDWKKCAGDGGCVKACPYNARFLDPHHANKADKCDFCAPLLAKGLEPACVENCPSHARVFGDLAEPQGEFATYLREIAKDDSESMNKHGERIFYTHASKS